jgi:hypothetical protein
MSLSFVIVLCLEGANACTAPANTLLAGFYLQKQRCISGIDDACAYVKRMCIELATCGRAGEVKCGYTTAVCQQEGVFSKVLVTKRSEGC